MATAAAASHAPAMASAEVSNLSAADRPALPNQNQMEAEDNSVEVDSAFGSEMYLFSPWALVGFAGSRVFG